MGPTATTDRPLWAEITKDR